MQIIDVEYPPLREPSFDTAGKAIASAKKQPINRTRVGGDLTPHVGRTITGVQWCDDAFRLQLDAVTLQFGAGPHGVDVELLPTGARPPWQHGKLADTVLVRHDEQEFIWERAAQMRALMGKPFRRLQLGTTLFTFLYTGQAGAVGILHLATTIDRTTSQTLLSWGPSD